MTDSNLNGIDDAMEDAREAEAYKSRAVSAKFKQQVSYGVGAAMVFGLVGAVATKLFSFAFPASLAGGGAVAGGAGLAVAPFSIPAILGLVALGVVGVGLLYLSAHYLSENTVLDQALQAKQISAATHARAPAIEPIVAVKTNHFPTPDALEAPAPNVPALAAANENTPLTRITAERALADTIVARGAANENTPVANDNANTSWEEKTASADAALTAKVRG